MAERSVTITLKLNTSDVIPRSAEAAKALDAVGKRAKEAGDKLDQLNRKLDETGRSMGVLGAKGVILNAVLGETQSRLKDVNTELGRTAPMTSAQTGLDKLKDKVKTTGDEQETLGKKTKETGRQFASAGSETSNLEVRLNAAKARVKELTAEFVRTNEDSSYTGLRKARSEVTSLEADFKAASAAAAKLLPSTGGTNVLGVSPPGVIARGLASVTNTSPELAAAIGAAIVIGSPVIGAALNGALLTGIGMGGITLGVLGQLKSPEVRDAAKEFGHGIMGALADATTGFQGPLAAGLHDIGGAVQALIKSINFDELAQGVAPFSHAIAGLVTEIGPGLREAFHASLPLLAEFGVLTPQIGHAISDMFHEIATAPGSIDGLRALANITIFLIENVGRLLNTLGGVFVWLQGLEPLMRTLGVALQAVGDILGVVVTAFGTIGPMATLAVAALVVYGKRIEQATVSMLMFAAASQAATVAQTEAGVATEATGTKMLLFSRAVGGIKSGLGSLVGMLGGPVGVGLIALSAGIGYVTNKEQAYNESIKDLTTSLESVGREYTAHHSVLTQQFQDLIQNNATLKDVVANQGKYGISIRTIAEAASGSRPALDQFYKLMLANNEVWANSKGKNLTQTILDQHDAFTKLAPALTEAYKQAKAYQVSQDALATAQNSATETSLTLSTAATNLGENFKPLVNLMGVWGDRSLTGAATQDAVSTALKEVAGSAVPARDALEAYDVIVTGIGTDTENAAQKTVSYNTLLGDIEHTAGTAASKNQALADTFWSIADAELSASDKASLLSKAWDDLYGAGIKQNDLMEQSKKDLLELQGSYVKNKKGVVEYQGSLDAHSRSLDTNSLQGIHNIDVIKSAATHLHQLFLADVEETGSVDIAKEHDAARKAQLEKTAAQTGLNRDKTKALIEQYDRIPPGKNTQVTITGDQAVLRKMQELEAINIVLMDPGTSLATARRDVGIGGPGGHATGGPIVGPGSGTSDSILARLSAGEHVWTAREVQAAGGHQAVEWLRSMVLSPRVERPGDGSQGIAFNIPGFAAGGGINFDAPWHVIANVARTHIPPPLMDASGNWTGPIPGNVAGIQSWIRAQAGKPYGWAEAGPGAYDCCIVAGTRVHGPDGAKPIQDVRAGDRVYSYVDGKQESHVVTAAWQSIRQPVFKVRTRNRMVTASANHPFLRVVRTGTELFEHWEDAEWGGPIRVAHRNSAGITCSVSICTEPRWSNGMCRKHRQRWSQHGDPRITLSRRARFETQWARLDELGPGDMLVQPRRLETDTVLDPVLSDGTPVDDDVAWLIGAAVGDGTVTSDSLRLCLFGDKRDRAATIIASRWGGQPCYGDSFGLISSRSRLARALADLGLAVLGPDKRMPEAVWSWPEELQRAFLEGYCDADGYRPVNQKRHGGRTYSSASRELIEDVRALHISLGDPVSNICVNNRIKPITIKGVRVKNARNLHSFTVWPNNGHGEAKFRNNPGLAEWLDSGDFTLASVLSITPMGDAVTWDLEVEGAHNFIADGVVVHNSGIVSAVWNMLHGRSPYSHTFSTSDEAGFFPRSGYGMFTAGWANPGERGGGSVGHTAGSLAGLQFESTGSRGVHVDNVTPLSSFAHLGHYDNGGYLQPGWTAAYNGTGRPEEVRPQFVGGRTVRVVYEHRIVVEGTGLLRALRKEIRSEGGNPLEVLGQ